jgi:Fe-S-cluster containining protein
MLSRKGKSEVAVNRLQATHDGVMVGAPSPTNCENCGACCENTLLRIPWMFGEDLKKIEEFCKVRGGAVIEYEGTRFWIFPNPCPNLDAKTKKCKIYEIRPQVCKEFQVGAQDCRVCRRFKNLD